MSEFARVERLDTIGGEERQVAIAADESERLALALDPFPRSPQAADALKQAGVLSEEEAGAFGALAELKAKLEKK